MAAQVPVRRSSVQAADQAPHHHHHHHHRRRRRSLLRRPLPRHSPLPASGTRPPSHSPPSASSGLAPRPRPQLVLFLFLLHPRASRPLRALSSSASWHDFWPSWLRPPRRAVSSSPRNHASPIPVGLG